MTSCDRERTLFSAVHSGEVFVSGLAWAGIALGLTIMAGCSRTPTAQSVIDRAIEVQGGAPEFAQVRVVERVISLYGTAEAGSTSGAARAVTLEAFDLVGRRMFVERSDGTSSVMRFYDFSKGEGWASSSSGSTTLGVKETPTDVAQLQVQFSEGTGFEVFSLGASLRSEKSPDGLDFAGQDTFDGHAVLVLAAKREESLGSGAGSVMLETRFLFDEGSGYLIGKQKLVSLSGSPPVKNEIAYSNYELVDGRIFLPHLIETRQQGATLSTISVQTLTLKPEMDPRMTERPAAPPK